MSSIGFTLPLMQTTSSLGYLASTSSEIDATYYNLRSLVLTNWGERPNHYYLGCNLIEFLFEPMRDEVRDRIIERIETQVATWLPYVQLFSIDVTFDEELTKINIQIKFGIRGRQGMESILQQSFPAGA